MRIISGKAKGTKLDTLEGLNTRPTLDRVKESVFNIIQSDLQDCIFLDVFAGSGAIGLEAASRGAQEVFMCEQSKQAIKIIEKNIQKTHLEQQIKLYNMDFKQMLSTKIDKKVDIVYIDPPYSTNYAYETLKILLEKEIINEKSIVIVETDRDEVLEELEKLEIKIIDKRKYGRAYIVFLTKRLERG